MYSYVVDYRAFVAVVSLVVIIIAVVWAIVAAKRAVKEN